jgi:hypothetical protein
MVRGPATLTCKEVVELVTELLGDALSADDRVRIEQHLLVCPPCSLYVGQVRSTVELAGRLRTEMAPAEVNPAILSLFRRWKQK